MAEHRVRKDNIIYIIPSDELFDKWMKNEAFIDDYGRLMNRKPNRVLKELKHYVDVVPTYSEPSQPIKNFIIEKFTGKAEELIEQGLEYFFYETLPNVWHKHVVPLYYEAKEVLSAKGTKMDQIKRKDPECKTIKVNKTSQIELTEEEIDVEKRKAVYHWISLLDALTKLQNAGELDRDIVLKKLTEPAMLEKVNVLLSENPNLLDEEKCIQLQRLLGRNLYEDAQLIPINDTEIKKLSLNYGGLNQ